MSRRLTIVIRTDWSEPERLVFSIGEYISKGGKELRLLLPQSVFDKSYEKF